MAGTKPVNHLIGVPVCVLARFLVVYQMIFFYPNAFLRKPLPIVKTLVGCRNRRSLQVSRKIFQSTTALLVSGNGQSFCLRYHKLRISAYFSISGDNNRHDKIDFISLQVARAKCQSSIYTRGYCVIVFRYLVFAKIYRCTPAITL